MKRKITLFPLLLALLFLLAACAAEPTSEATVEPSSTEEAAETSSRVEATLESAGVIETREPRPTATPGVLTETVDNIAEAVHLQDVTILGLSGADWLNLVISLIIVVLGYIIGSIIARLLNRWAAGYLKDDQSKILFKKVTNMLRWVIVLLALNFATIRLVFLSVPLKNALLSIYFVTAVLLATRGVWYLVDIGEAELRVHLSETGREQDLSPALVLGVRLLRVVLVLVAATIILSYFGINMTAFAALLGLSGLAFSLAARDTIEDAIAGVIILADQPFRVGDRIEVAAANTWGDVVDIGLRTTRIRTRDNRLVIIPNSLISKNEIINYTYPDPTYRIETHVGLDYDTDIERARRIMAEAVHEVPNVLDDRPIDILYSDMGESAMIFRVRWWIETYADTRRVTDEVHTALQGALDEAGIKSPYPTQSIFLHGEEPAAKNE